MDEDTRERPVETSLFWLSSRYYSPELCRFISPDDVDYLDPESVNGLNLYCYCYNNPISYSNPSGHLPQWAEWLIGGAVIVCLGNSHGLYRRSSWSNSWRCVLWGSNRCCK
ncbi:MAG: hypothetical protein IJ501_01080 [Bacilli bacterium]|nr:hypothetical protein [Bacilli bacterium]MBQ8472076.1 hypothetical protein [Bacilli bacterium]